MTREQILKLEAGPELDRLMAEKVMGWNRTTEGAPPGCAYWKDDDGFVRANETLGGSLNWNPSTDVAAAMEVVLHVIKTLDCNVQVVSEVCFDPFTDKRVIMWYVVLEPYRKRHLAELVKGTSRDSLPLAICRAALLAALEEVER